MNKLVKQAKGIEVEKTAEDKKSDFNEYQEAIYLCMSVLEAYDNDRHIPFLGFGAKLPPTWTETSSCFAMNGNIFNPESNGVEGLMVDYVKGMPKLTPHGPAAHAEVIKYAIRYSEF